MWLKRTQQFLQGYLEKYFWLRWLLAHSLGWPLAIYLGLLCISWLGGAPSLILAGGITSGIISLLQLAAMGTPFTRRIWLFASIIGGLLGGCLLFFFAIIGALLFFLWISLGLVPLLIFGGAIYGVCIGAAQGWVIARHHARFGYYWALAWCFGGAICGFTSGLFMFNWICWPGPIAFALILGYLWRHWRQHLTHEPSHT